MYYGPRLKMLHCCTDQAITNALAEMDLTAAQGHLLAYVSRQQEAPCPRDIEEVFHLSHATVSGLLSRMEKKAFIAIRPDEQDRRCKRIHMLPKGTDCAQKMHDVILSIEQRMVQDFTPEEQSLFLSLLDRSIRNMGGNPHPCCKEEKPL